MVQAETHCVDTASFLRLTVKHQPELKGEVRMGKKNQYLCDWKKSDISDDLDKLKTIVRNPRYVCMKCARVARDAEYLHKPEGIEE